MDPFYFSCPHCSAHLRVRDPLSLVRSVDCPECGKYLLLVEALDAEGKVGLRVIPAANPGPLKLENGQSAQPGGARQAGPATSGEPHANPSRKSRTRPKLSPDAESLRTDPGRQSAFNVSPIPNVAWYRRPLVVAWLATGTCATAVLAYVFLGASGPSSTIPPTSGRPAGPADARESDGPSVAASDNGDGSVTSEAESIAARSRFRLERVGSILVDNLELESAFPAGTLPATNLRVEQRLSWQALLADRFDDAHPPMAPDQPWNDPLNDPFVRRRLHEFQNPAIAALTGADGYPATHFVGVAGVGDDAARLPAGDLRAGIFGDDRRTRMADIRDGASNTWLVLGVREHLGSWAAGGRSTVRPLTREPYVNGPDGFGTGAADSMFALLADGSVRVVSADADPSLLRNLAAMADGFPNDSQETAAEYPVDADDLTSAIGKPISMTAGSDVPDDLPLEPEFAPEPVRKQVDLVQSLRQPILLYDLPRARPLHEWLPGVADMIGAPIRFDDAELGSAVAGLRTPVRLRLENTTVGEILEALLKPAGLTFRVETDHIHLAPRR